jgi:hypothetical protein
MRMQRARFVAVAVGLSLAGCSLLTSLDGLSGGAAPSAIPPEGSADAMTAADVGASEAASPLDSGDSGEGGPIDPCAGAVLCDHFERDQVQGDWATIFGDNGGTAVLDTTTFTSPTKSLALHVPPADGGNIPHAQLGSASYAGVAHARVSFSMKIGAPDRQVSLMRLQFSESDRGEVFDLYMLPGKYVASEQGMGAANAGYVEYPVASGFKANVWQRWTLEVDATGPSAVGIVVLDGQEVVRHTLTNVYRRSSFSVLLGAYYAPGGPSHDVFYDDVSITIFP